MKSVKKIIIVSFVIFCLMFSGLQAFAAQQPTPTFKIQSVYNQDINNFVDQNGNPVHLDTFPKFPDIYAIDSNNNKIPIHYKATHQILGKSVENGITTYSMVTDIDVAVSIQRVPQTNNLLSLLEPNYAYADDASRSDSYSTLTQSYRLYWAYVQGQLFGQTVKYYRFTDMHAYWARSNQSYTVGSAQFGAGISGYMYPNNGIGTIYSFWGNTFVPQWTSSSGYLNTYVYDETQKPYVNWAYMCPEGVTGMHDGLVSSSIGYWSGSQFVTVAYLQSPIYPDYIDGV